MCADGPRGVFSVIESVKEVLLPQCEVPQMTSALMALPAVHYLLALGVCETGVLAIEYYK